MSFATLHEELTIWQAEQRALPLWWRDDDAVAVTPELEAMAARATRAGLKVHLAVIPRDATEALATRVAEDTTFVPMVHGWAHISHAPEGAKNSEFGTPRAGATADAERGLARLSELFGPQLLPIFVPPWNRIDPSVITTLPGLGYRGLSTFQPREAREAVPGLIQINTHIDPVDWRGTRSLTDPDTLTAWLTAHLQDRRSGRADATEPLGLLTHHLMQDRATWDFCERLLEMLLAGPAVPADIYQL